MDLPDYMALIPVSSNGNGFAGGGFNANYSWRLNYSEFTYLNNKYQKEKDNPKRALSIKKVSKWNKSLVQKNLPFTFL